MARKPVQVQRFTNADQLAIGQKARFIGADGLEYETSPIAHFDVHPDGRISITTQSGSTYGNFDFEAQRIKDNAEWEAKFNNDQQAHYEKSLQVAMMKAQGAAQQELVNQFMEDARFGYGNYVGQIAPNANDVWCLSNSGQWEQISLAEIQEGMTFYMRDCADRDLSTPNAPTIQHDFNTVVMSVSHVGDSINMVTSHGILSTDDITAKLSQQMPNWRDFAFSSPEQMDQARGQDQSQETEQDWGITQAD